MLADHALSLTVKVPSHHNVLVSVL